MKVKQKKCKVCGKLFTPYTTLDKFCKIWCKKEFEKQKRVKVREQKKMSISALTKTLDVVFSQYIRLRDCIETTWTTTHLKCFTCDADVEYSKSQNMHFVWRAVKSLRYDEDNCHWWCMRCNVILHGNYLEYFVRMEKKYWRKKVDEMISKKYEIWKVTQEELLEKIAYYKEKLKNIKEN